jgi:hypothetical protein
MIPKEKAEELIEKFESFVDYNECDVFTGRQNMLKNAKQCAFISVAFAKDNPLNTEGYNKYLDEVKQEIESYK